MRGDAQYICLWTTQRRAFAPCYLRHMSMTASEMGKKGAAATNAKLSPEQRTKNAKRAAKARWKKALSPA